MSNKSNAPPPAYEQAVAGSSVPPPQPVYAHQGQPAQPGQPITYHATLHEDGQTTHITASFPQGHPQFGPGYPAVAAAGGPPPMAGPSSGGQPQQLYVLSADGKYVPANAHYGNHAPQRPMPPAQVHATVVQHDRGGGRGSAAAAGAAAGCAAGCCACLACCTIM